MYAVIYNIAIYIWNGICRLLRCRQVPVSFVPQLLPQAFADHLLRSFMQEAWLEA